MADKPDASKPKGSGLARFAYLLDPNADHTISRPPVTYDKPDDGSKSSEQHSEATSKTGNDPGISPDAKTLPKLPLWLRNGPSLHMHPRSPAFPKFNPQKRPKQTKKPKLPGSAPKPSPSEQPPDASEPGSGVQHNIHHIEDWAAEDEDADVFQNGPKRQRGGRKKRKKDQVTYDYATDWDAIYDPLKPNVYEAYIGSEEEVRAEREWKDYLYKNSRRGMKREESGSSQESDDRAQKKRQSLVEISLIETNADTDRQQISRHLQISLHLLHLTVSWSQSRQGLLQRHIILVLPRLARHQLQICQTTLAAKTPTCAAYECLK